MTVAGRAIEELYAVPPSAFTRERTAKAAELAKAGRADEARAVRRLRRPTASLWATNQLARTEGERLAALIDAVAQARSAQLRDPRGAAEALRRQRAGIEALVKRAGELLGSQGYRLTPATARRISDTLLGAAVDRELAADLRRGRLTKEVPPPGFEVLAGVRPAEGLRLLPGGRDHRATGRSAVRDRAHEERRQRQADIERRRQATREQRREAELARQREADDARRRRRQDAEAREREAQARRAAVQQVQREVAEAAAALAETRGRLRGAKAAATAAAAAARKARAAAR